MRKNILETLLYKEAEALYTALRQPGTGRISDAAELHVSPDGRWAVFAGTIVDALVGSPPTRICLTDLTSGDTRVVTFGPNCDRSPKFAPNGRLIAFLSDRHAAGDFQLYLLDPIAGAARPAGRVDGWIEYLHWSADGQRILLGVAGHGADVAGAQGAVASQRIDNGTPSWMPEIETGRESHRWRRVWLYELEEARMFPLPVDALNIWEAVWCGNDAIAAVASADPSEGSWYGARLYRIELNGFIRETYAPRDQLAWPAASASGRNLAIVEAICSDRGSVAGDLRLIDASHGSVRSIDTAKVDVTYLEWRSENMVLIAGHRGFESVLGHYDLITNEFTEIWSSTELTSPPRYMAVAGLDNPGDCVLLAESYLRAPEIGTIRNGAYRTIKSLDPGYAGHVAEIGSVEQVRWLAPDGLEIGGWLLRPMGQGPHPLIMNIHGGPVSHWRPMWLGRPRALPMLMLIKHGYAVFFPNPRGSLGCGQEFARHVLGDMCGADTQDYLSGIDHLIARNIADPKRLGVMGVSYGGLMTSWLITQTSRFAAAVAVAPSTNQVTQHLLSNIPQFVALFLDDHYTVPGGKYFQRSPIMQAHRAKTPTLNICGALDRCTPPEEARQFHNALLENGVESSLVTYPEEGHGVRKFPAAIDYAARVVSWFNEHMPKT